MAGERVCPQNDRTMHQCLSIRFWQIDCILVVTPVSEPLTLNRGRPFTVGPSVWTNNESRANFEGLLVLENERPVVELMSDHDPHAIPMHSTGTSVCMGDRSNLATRSRSVRNPLIEQRVSHTETAPPHASPCTESDCDQAPRRRLAILGFGQDIA
jgi:hypothetical protein